MANASYVKGVRFERRVKAYLERKGMVCLRTAGSHGAVDLVAFNSVTGMFIQCKDVKSASLCKDGLETLRALPNPSVWRRQVWAKIGKKIGRAHV